MTTPALAAAEAAGFEHRVIRHGPVRSLAEAAQARGVPAADVVKTMVVRRGPDDFLFVLVPGDRSTITPLGSTRAWPVVADERIRGRQITLGAGEHGVAIAAAADDLIKALDATVADVTEPES